MCKLTDKKSKETNFGEMLLWLIQVVYLQKYKSITRRKLFYNYGMHNYLKSDDIYKRVLFQLLPNTRHRHKLYSAQHYPFSMWTARTDLDYL